MEPPVSASPTVPQRAGCRVPAPSSPSPRDLPPVGRADIALIDVDNLVIGSDGIIHRELALAAIAEVYGNLGGVELSLAVVSRSAARQLGADLWFMFPNWTWRLAEESRDAADHQLLDFGRSVQRQRPRSRVAVASGDGIFAELARDLAIEVVLPKGHRGVSARLRPFVRPPRSPRALGRDRSAMISIRLPQQQSDRGGAGHRIDCESVTTAGLVSRDTSARGRSGQARCVARNSAAASVASATWVAPS